MRGGGGGGAGARAREPRLELPNASRHKVIDPLASAGEGARARAMLDALPQTSGFVDATAWTDGGSGGSAIGAAEGQGQ